MDQPVSAPDRRREPRLPLALTAHCQVGTDYSRGHLTDLSSSGLGLTTGSAWPPGTSVRVAMALPYSDGPRFCTLSGTVVRRVAGLVGLKLDPHASHTDREVFQGFLALLAMRRAAQA